MGPMSDVFDADLLDPAVREIRDLVREVTRRVVAPRAAEIDATGEFPEDVRRAFADAGLFGLPFDAAYGGTGTGTLAVLVAVEEIARACATSALMLSVQDLGAIALRLVGTDEQRARYLPKLASGEWLPAYALTESEAGSDAAALRSTATRDGDAYVLSGGKRFITNAGVAGLYTVFAKTDPEAGSKGITAFLVEANSTGLEVLRVEPKMGIKGSTTGELAFDDVRVPIENRLGEEGDGFAIAMRVLDRSRPGIAAQALGLAQGATDVALAYAAERRSFGQPIAKHQLVAAMLADMETRTWAARGLLYRVGRMIDAGADGPELTKAAAMAKLFCSDTAMSVTTDAVQVLGGYGYMREFPVERMMRDAKITQIYEGTNQIQRLVIAREMLRERRDPPMV
jgi:alkylation response protein AidB-like acyl-CoA dehydrogenase